MNKTITLTLFATLTLVLTGSSSASKQDTDMLDMDTGKYEYSDFNAMEATDGPVTSITSKKEEKPSDVSTINPDDPKSFEKGYNLFEQKKYKKALPHLHHYLSQNSPDDIDYEWAEFFFGISLMRCGFTHAAVDILSHLVTRKPNQKIVSYCLDLFEKITRTVPFDRELIVHKVICDQEYGFVEKEIADFINYYQGTFDWEHGFFSWGNSHFNKITPKTYYYYKYLYQKALFRVYENRIDDATVLLKEIIETEALADDFKDEVRRTLARLFYEKGQFKESIEAYQHIKKPILKQAGNLLERAWSQYRIGNPEKAMGLLYAFEAPGFKDYFTPEYYLLKSFIYKDVCHYQKVLKMVDEFRSRYKNSLENIYNRGKAKDDPALLLVLLKKNQIDETWRFLNLLKYERTRCSEIQDKPFRDYMEKIYDLQVEESINYFRRLVREEYEKIANELLKYEEEAYLMEYEIGLDMSQRVYQYRYGMDNKNDQKRSERIIAYPFQGEFWNDELSDYKVTLRNKCECMEEWDIFFK
ncbi:MAG: hypothetical protein SVY10_19430 [Thermodesulfobacteriota bacterium]|nr:hypothetical protein [Thermodesulfobacteriota bacterium]